MKFLPSIGLRRCAGLLSIAAIAFSIMAAPVMVWAEKGDLRPVSAKESNGPPLYVTLGKAELVELPGDVSDVMVANPSIVDVQAIKSNRLYVVGSKVGDTNLIAIDASGSVLKRIDIHVKYDLQAIQALVNELYPDEKVKVGAIHDQILLSGTVSTPEIASKITNIVGQYVGDLQDTDDKSADQLVANLLNVTGEQQVTLQVKIVEARRNVIKELGIQTSLNTPTGVATGSTTGLGLGAGAGTALNNPANGVLQIFQLTKIAELGDLNVVLNALDNQNLVHILAEPNLTAVSGEQAGFLAGGETPVPSGVDQLGNIVIEFRQFGVSLNFKPVVLSDQRISLQMSTEVSSINFQNALPAGDIQVPGFDVRRANTTVEIPSGRSIMIAGLLQSSALKGMKGIPGIDHTPVLGDLISSRSFQRDETELVVIVTPYIVEPYKEKERAEIRNMPPNPLAKSFAKAMRKQYAIKDEDIFGPDERYGYILK